MPLQKSYSDRNHWHKQRPQWHRSRSHPGLQQDTPTKPPVPLCESTKSKLQNLQFQPPPEVTHADNDRAVPSAEKSAIPDGTNDALGTAGKENASTAKPEDKSSMFLNNVTATTPIARLAWQDLMGTRTEEKPAEEVSPTERIMWKTGKDDKLMNLVSHMLPEPKQGKKRARSSSPPSSPANATEPMTPAVNVKKLTEALRTPHADPALDLWDRFSLATGSGNNTKNGPRPDAVNSLLTQLMVSSSPRPTADGTPSRKARDMRRSISAAEPRAKRRRVDMPADIRSPFHPGLPAQEAPSKTSMLSHLLETVTGELERCNTEPIVRASTPVSRSSSKGSPGRTRRSPQRRAADRSSPQRHGQEPMQKVSGIAESVLTAETPQEKDDKSDYGSDTFDDDALMELDARFMTNETTIQTKVEPLQPFAAARPTNTNANERQQTPSGSQTAEDDFGDFDADVLTAAEGLVAGIDSQLESQRVSAREASSLAQQEALQDDGLGDEFGGGLDLDAALLAATQQSERRSKQSSLSHPSQKQRAIQRYLVTNVFNCSYTDDAGRECPEKILVIEAERTSSVKTVHLRGDWLDTPVSTKAFIHIVGEFESAGHCVIDNAQNLLILHPDQLISSTVIADSFSCMRRAVLQDRVKATSEAAPALVYGTMLHEIFQEALTANQWDLKYLASVVDYILGKHIEDLYIIKTSTADAREHLLSKMTELRDWAKTFVSPYPKKEALVQGRHGEKISMCVNKLLDVEEHVWSPMYGLKGNIDATVQVTMQDPNGPRTLTVPFEVKTGKNVSSNHQAQTVLYNLLLSDRYDIEIAYGILYYMETSQTIRIPAIRHELRHMIMQRNQLACYIRERRTQLPPMKKSKNACGKCFAQTSCFTYHKLADDGDGEKSGMGKEFEEVVAHLTPTHKEFFLKWEDLLTKEEKESQKMRRELWTLLSTEREKLGRCFANVTIEKGSSHEEVHTSKINRFQYTFIKDGSPAAFSFLDSQLAVGEPIVVSDEQGHFALALGYVTNVKKHRITVAIDRRLHNARIRQPGFDEEDNQVFAGIMEVRGDGVNDEQAPTTPEPQRTSLRYRLDKDEFSNGMATVRNNLVQVMAEREFGSREIRRLVVDLEPPRFKPAATQYHVEDSSLNVDQKQAIAKVMSARDYALVLGMPGTGKTTTISHIIRALVQQGKSVLLTSYTHTAVDNILLKLRDSNLPILRLGAPTKVHPEVQEFVALAGQPMQTFEQIRSAWHDSPIVATTCLGINHPVFNERTFDYCIVDEASQITLPICLGPIRMAKTFVLVGDHNQLPPLVQNEAARLGGLDVSLFKLLSETHPDSVVNLEHQYRMCEDVMTLSNILIYSGRLKCGTQELRSRKLDVPQIDALGKHHFDADTLLLQGRSSQRSLCVSPRPGTCWLRDLIEPSARVRFVNTDSVPDSREEAKGNRIVNPCEARIVAQLVESLLDCGVPASEVGVMTHYRSQLALLRHTLQRSGRRGTSTAGIEMHTADRFQGRDKDVVILSLVRSNAACNIGDLLRDWRRINVAFTRAKTKLLVVGSRETLKGSGEGEMLARFIGLMEERGWIYDLGVDALDVHLFDDGVAATATTQGSPVKGFGSSPIQSQRSPLGSTRKISPKRILGATPRATGKENAKIEPKKARIGERALLKGKPILRDIFNDMIGGA